MLITAILACSPLTNAAAVNGNIAIVDRGTCGFIDVDLTFELLQDVGWFCDDVGVTHTYGGGPIPVGTNYAYTLNVVNNDSGTERSATLTDTLPPGTFVGAWAPTGAAARRAAWSPARVPPRRGSTSPPAPPSRSPCR